MSEMVERVARSIEQASQPPGQKDYKILMENCALAAIQELGEPTAEMLKGGMQALEESRQRGEPLEAQVAQMWWEMICIAQPMPERTKEDDERWEKLLAEAKIAAGIAETGT